MKEISLKTEDIQRVQLIAQKEGLSFREALLYLDLSESSLYKMVSESKINYFKPNGGKLYFKKSDLDNWMLQNECKSIGVLENELLTKISSNGNKKQY